MSTRKVNGKAKERRPHRFEFTTMNPRDILVSTDNAKLYGAVDRHSREFKGLCRSLNRYDILDPLVVTADGWLLSGHKRLMAAILLGFKTVPVVVVQDFNREDNEKLFLRWLAEYNATRTKSRIMLARETLVKHSKFPEFDLFMDTLQADPIGVEPLSVVGTKKTSRPGERTKEFVDAVLAVLFKLAKWLPVTVRAVHYPLVPPSSRPFLTDTWDSDSYYQNDQASYDKLCRLVLAMRVHEMIPWSWIIDESQEMTDWAPHKHVGTFIEQELDWTFSQYSRDLLQSQSRHVVVYCEKHTQRQAVEAVCRRYTVPFICGAGTCKGEKKRAIFDRFKESGKKKLALLALTDYDPAGFAMPNDIMISIRDWFGVDENDLELIRVGISPEHVERFGIPESFEQAKNQNAVWKQHGGGTCYELDALAPDQVETILEETICAVLDHKAFRREQREMKADEKFIAALKDGAIKGATRAAKQLGRPL